jgi:hypothetical protein
MGPPTAAACLRTAVAQLARTRHGYKLLFFNNFQSRSIFGPIAPWATSSHLNRIARQARLVCATFDKCERDATLLRPGNGGPRSRRGRTLRSHRRDSANLALAARGRVGHIGCSGRRGRVAEGGGLLNRYRVVKPYRGFESLRLRHPPSLKLPRRAFAEAAVAPELRGSGGGLTGYPYPFPHSLRVVVHQGRRVSPPPLPPCVTLFCGSSGG